MQARLSSLSKQKGMIKDDFKLPDMKWALQTRASLIVAFSQSARLIACSHRCRLFFWNGWDPAGILKNLTPELVRFSQSTTQQIGICSWREIIWLKHNFNGLEWTFWPQHAHCELQMFLWRQGRSRHFKSVGWGGGGGRNVYVYIHICLELYLFFLVNPCLIDRLDF